jgi:hypothetical protein
MGQEKDGFQDLDPRVAVYVHVLLVWATEWRTSREKRNRSRDKQQAHISPNAACTAALRTFTATTGFSAATAVSNGSSELFSYGNTRNWGGESMMRSATPGEIECSVGRNHASPCVSLKMWCKNYMDGVEAGHRG